LRMSPAYEAGKNGSQRRESRELLRLLGEAGFGIARRNGACGEMIGDQECRAALYVLTSETAPLVRTRPAGTEDTIGLLKEWGAFGRSGLPRGSGASDLAR
jgi:hypothetical protein